MKTPLLAFLSLLLVLLPLSAAAQSATDNDYLYVFSRGKVLYKTKASEVDSIALTNLRRRVTFYNKKRNILYNALRTNIDSITLGYQRPVADLLDVVFHADGTAEDVSPMKNTVQCPSSTGLFTYYNETYKRYVANFNNAWGSTATGFYKIDYTNNAAFRNALADGHTLELVVMANYPGVIANTEAKPFSSMQAGGTGFLISTISGTRQNELTFLPNVSTNGASTWRWTTSGIVPQNKVYYHLIGAWDKSTGLSTIYVNGELKNTINAAGSLNFPAGGATWFAIGGDPGSATACEAGWCGDVVLARIYDRALTQDDVDVLWQDIKKLQDEAPPVEPDMVTDVDYYTGLAVKAGFRYTIWGKGFAEGDQIRLQNLADLDKEFLLPTELVSDGVVIQLPEQIATAQYRMALVRGEKTQQLGFNRFQVVGQLPIGSKVIAHRGHWNVAGASQNSRKSLQNALDLHVYGSETDVWLTRDGHLMVNHDASFGGVTLESATFAQASNLRLSNGEKMPELKELLEMLSDESPTKLIIEIKTHTDPNRGLAAADSTVALVHRMGLQDKVEYIAFSIDICRRLAQDDPDARVAYLNGGLSPAELHQDGITGLDYTAVNFRQHPEWPEAARALQMTTNVWTIDAPAEIIEMNVLGIDYITTNNPEGAAKIYQLYQQNAAAE